MCVTEPVTVFPLTVFSPPPPLLRIVMPVPLVTELPCIATLLMSPLSESTLIPAPPEMLLFWIVASLMVEPLPLALTFIPEPALLFWTVLPCTDTPLTAEASS